jgi:hypothetical protein
MLPSTTVKRNTVIKELNNGAGKRHVCTFKSRSTFNPYAGLILFRFYGYDLSPSKDGHPKKTVRMYKHFLGMEKMVILIFVTFLIQEK